MGKILITTTDFSEEYDNIKELEKIIIFAKENENISISLFKKILDDFQKTPVDVETYKTKEELLFLVGMLVGRNYSEDTEFIISSCLISLSKTITDKFQISTGTEKKRTRKKKTPTSIEIKNVEKIEPSIKKGKLENMNLTNILDFMKKTNIRKQMLPDGFDGQNEDLVNYILNIINTEKDKDKILGKIKEEFTEKNAEYITDQMIKKYFLW